MQELVEHIRTVHFTVLIVALVLTAALQIEKKRPLERAADDAEAILQLSERWPETIASIELQLDRQAAEDHLHFPKVMENGSILPKPGRYDLAAMNKGHQIGDFRESFTINDHWIFFDEADKAAKTTRGEIPRWMVLSDFSKFWEGLHSGKSFFLPLVLGSDPKDRIYCGTLTPHTLPYSDFVIGNGSLMYIIGHQEGSVKGTWTVRPMIDQDKSMIASCNFTAVDLVPETVELSQVFGRVVPGAARWGNRSFPEEFAELIASSKYLEDTPLPRLASALRDRANTDTERIELFQAKLPASAIPTFGSVILLCCQFYLLAHLLELHRCAIATEPEDRPTGYIGLYKGHLVFAFVVISLVIFPAVPLLMSARSGAGILRAWELAALFVSIGLGALSTRELVGIRASAVTGPPTTSRL